MTTLYRPVKITSAEQAEALPLWTMATIEHHPQDALPQIAMRIVRGWRNRDLIDGRIPHADMVGWTALVPIEAEEVRVIEHGRLERDMCGCTVLETSFEPEARDYRRTEYRTPWRPADRITP